MIQRQAKAILLLILTFTLSCEKEKVEFGHSDLKILFQSRHWDNPCCTNYYLYQMDFDGNNVTKVLDSMVLAFDFHPSNDNSKILFEYENYEDPNSLIIFDRVSSLYKTIDEKGSRFPSFISWSNDDSKIVYSKYDNIYVYDLQLDSLIQLTHSDNNYAPSFSPDGQKISFLNEKDFYIMDTDGTNMKLLVSDKVGRYHWSPDGEKIVFQGTDELKCSQIYIMDSEGNSITKLTDSRIANPEAGVWQMVIDEDTVNMENDYFGNYKPQFSSNGENIFYLSSIDANNRVLMKMDIEGNNKKEFSNVPDYNAISTDSRFVLYTIDLGGIANEQIILVDIETGLKKNLSAERMKDTEPKFDKY